MADPATNTRDKLKKLVERWRPADERPEIATETLRWHLTGAPEELSIDLTRIFSAAGPEDETGHA